MLNTTHFHHLGSSLHPSARAFSFLVANNTSFAVEPLASLNGEFFYPKQSITYVR
jgi:hypothetical protein